MTIKPKKKTVKRKVSSKSIKRLNPSYLLGDIVTRLDDIEHEVKEFLIGEKVKLKFQAENNSSITCESIGILEKNSKNLYFVTNKFGHFSFKLIDISFIDKFSHDMDYKASIAIGIKYQMR